MKERAILFSGAMVRALLGGTKTQTRRVAGVTHEGCKPGFITPKAGFVPRRVENHISYCPYGQVGDRLYVRESAWYDREVVAYAGRRAFFDGGDVRFEKLPDTAKAPGLPENSCAELFNLNASLIRRPSIHMPRWASRLTLEITGIRVERVQDIREVDAIAEGCVSTAVVNEAKDDYTGAYASENFAELWDSLNKKRGYGWDVNPWCWVLEFKRVGQDAPCE